MSALIRRVWTEETLVDEPSGARKKTRKRKLEDLKTKTGKPIAEADASDLYVQNNAPGFAVLSRHTPCRLRDPKRPNLQFWVASAVPFNEAFVKSLRKSLSLNDRTDILLWVRERNPEDRSTPLQLYESSEQKQREFEIVDPTEDDGSVLQARAKVVMTSEGSVKYASSRRSGWIVLRDLHTFAELLQVPIACL
jgi:hypothetical protein